MNWIAAVSIAELDEKQRVIVKHGARPIAVMKSGDRIFAVDNRCPHEGYPLKEGVVDAANCVLTCNWHNWKFDLNTGRNIVGEDNVAVYETKREDGRVWIKIPEVARERLQAAIMENLRGAFLRRQYGRMARELARLHFNRFDPAPAVACAIEWSYDRLEYGMGHEYAAAADWLTLYDQFEAPDRRIACLVEALDFIADESLRQPAFPFTGQRASFSDDAFLMAIEREDQTQAVALLNDALDAGLHFKDLERAFTEAALRHYNDFGHSLIYVGKAGRLIERLGPGVERYLLPALIRSICLATREDLLPEFRKLPAYLEKWRAPASADDASSGPALSAEALVYQPVDRAMEWVVQQSGRSGPEPIYAALLEANARHLLHYDVRLQFSYRNPVSKNIGWLDFTHSLTFAHAARQQCRKFPEFWKYALLQMACFSGRNHTFVDRGLDEAAWFVTDADAFLAEALDQVLDHGKATPIFSVHWLKTCLAARQEAATTNDRCAQYLWAALNRFLHSSLREKHVRRTAHQALELVGKDFEA